MNYVSLNNAYPATFIGSAFEPDNSDNDRNYLPAYGHCSVVISHMDKCSECQDKLKKLIADQMNQSMQYNVGPTGHIQMSTNVNTNDTSNITSVGASMNNNTIVQNAMTEYPEPIVRSDQQMNKYPMNQLRYRGRKGQLRLRERLLLKFILLLSIMILIIALVCSLFFDLSGNKKRTMTMQSLRNNNEKIGTPTPTVIINESKIPIDDENMFTMMNLEEE